MKAEKARRVAGLIEEVVRARPDPLTLGLEVEALLRTVVPFDRSCWHNVDPATSIITSVIGDSAPTDPLLPAIEYGEQDINKYADLARVGMSAGILSQATKGELENTRRYRDVYKPAGIEDELTTVFVSAGELWGCARLYREQGRDPFETIEAAYVARIARLLAEGFRNSVVASPLETEADLSPGLILVDDAGRIRSITPAAQRCLEELIDPMTPGSFELPQQIHAIAAHARSPEPHVDPDKTVRLRLPTKSGHWLLAHVSRTKGEQVGTAIIIEPAPSLDIAPLIAMAYGLTERERQVMELAAQGYATKQIAAALDLSRYTVQDHLKSIFEKVGVNGRQELIARIFFKHYGPRLSSDRGR